MNTQMTSIMINPFVKYKGLEFFGVLENISGRDDTKDVTFTSNRNWNQLGAELLYRFGENERFYVGGRYNTASGQQAGEETNKVKVNRVQFGGGWFMTPNILAKAEYVNQQYLDYPTSDIRYNGGKFDGVMLEAVIAF